MALSVKSVNEIRRYFNGVVERAGHHALNVSEVIYPLLGFILLHFDPSSDIEVREYNGIPANMLWVHINGKKYTFQYNHQHGNIEIKNGGMNGPVLHTIDNNNTIADLKVIFGSL
jgi:hypothetical protein